MPWWSAFLEEKSIRITLINQTLPHALEVLSRFCFFSLKGSTVYTSQLNKGKLARVGIDGPDKFCVKQQIYRVIFLHRKVFSFVRDFAKLLQGG